MYVRRPRYKHNNEKKHAPNSLNQPTHTVTVTAVTVTAVTVTAVTATTVTVTTVTHILLRERVPSDNTTLSYYECYHYCSSSSSDNKKMERAYLFDADTATDAEGLGDVHDRASLLHLHAQLAHPDHGT